MNESSRNLPSSENKLLITPKKEICQSSETLSECCGCSRFSAKKHSARRRLVSRLSTPPNSCSPTPKHMQATPATSQNTATTVINSSPNEKEKINYESIVGEESSFECQSLSSWSTMTGSEGHLESIDFINFFFENFGKANDKILIGKTDATLDTDITLCCSPVPWCHDNGTGARFLTPITCIKDFPVEDSFRLKNYYNSFEDLRSSSAFESSPSSYRESNLESNNIPFAPVNSPNVTSDLTTSSSSGLYAKTEHESTDNESRMEINGNSIDCNLYLLNKKDSPTNKMKSERYPCIGQEDTNKLQSPNKYYNNNLIFAESISNKYNRQRNRIVSKKKYERRPHDHRSSGKVYMWLKHMNEQNDKNALNLNNSNNCNYNEKSVNSESHFNNQITIEENLSPPKKRRSQVSHKKKYSAQHKLFEENFEASQTFCPPCPSALSKRFQSEDIYQAHQTDERLTADCNQCYLCNQGFKLPPNVNECINPLPHTPSGYLQKLKLNDANCGSSKFKCVGRSSTCFVDQKYDITYIQENNSRDFLNKLKNFNYLQKQKSQKKSNISSVERKNSLLRQFKKNRLNRFSVNTNETVCKKFDFSNNEAPIGSNRVEIDDSTNHLRRLSSGRKRRAAKRLHRFGKLAKKKKVPTATLR